MTKNNQLVGNNKSMLQKGKHKNYRTYQLNSFWSVGTRQKQNFIAQKYYNPFLDFPFYLNIFIIVTILNYSQINAKSQVLS
jgi:hypothetical protein